MGRPQPINLWKLPPAATHQSRAQVQMVGISQMICALMSSVSHVDGYTLPHPLYRRA
ncbi:MAG: hypothetical protein R2825_29315 [Saprospiraceae bacterium]